MNADLQEFSPSNSVAEVHRQGVCYSAETGGDKTVVKRIDGAQRTDVDCAIFGSEMLTCTLQEELDASSNEQTLAVSATDDFSPCTLLLGDLNGCSDSRDWAKQHRHRGRQNVGYVARK